MLVECGKIFQDGGNYHEPCMCACGVSAANLNIKRKLA